MPLPLDQLSPVSRYRLGHHDAPQAQQAHADESREWRRERADRIWTPQFREQLVSMLADDPDPAAVMAHLGMTVGSLYGRMSYDAALSHAVETVLADRCPARSYVTATYPWGSCGTATGYERGRGRCQACRDAHRGCSQPRT